MVEIFPFSPSDYDEVMALWQATEGLTLREADSREAVTSYLARNRPPDGHPVRLAPSLPGCGAG